VTNEEFQKIVLQELKSLREGQNSLEERQKNLEESQKDLIEGQKTLLEGQIRLEERQTKLEERQMKLEERQGNLEEEIKDIKKDLKAVIDQTADLTEFREEANKKLDFLIEDNRSIHEILGEHEISIRTLRRRPVV
jgi:peptidoglycan hydrolase CwlO-like protein